MEEENIIEETIDNVKTDATDFENADFNTEENNYSRLSFKRLQKLRVDGVAFGIKIPVLQYNLRKPEKKRATFIVFGIISSIILALGLISATWLLVALTPSFLEMVGVSNIGNDNPELALLTLGILDLFGGVMSIFFWLLIIAFLAIIICIIVSLTKTVINFFGLVNCSIQEMAIGHEVRDMIFSAITLIILSAFPLGLFIYGLAVGGQISNIIIIIFVASLLAFAYAICMLVFILIEKKKAKEIFKTLPEEEQENFRAHTNSIARVKHNIKRITKSGDSETDYFNFF